MFRMHMISSYESCLNHAELLETCRDGVLFFVYALFLLHASQCINVDKECYPGLQ